MKAAFTEIGLNIVRPIGKVVENAGLFTTLTSSMRSFLGNTMHR